MANNRRGYYSLMLGGKKRTLHFSFNFWANLTDKLGITLEEIGSIFESGFDMSAFRCIIYCGVLTYDQEEDNEIDYNEFKVGNWLEDVTAEQIQEIVETMSESRILGNDLNTGIERNPKIEGK